MTAYTKTMILLIFLSSLMIGLGSLLGGATGALIAFVISLLLNGMSYWYSDKIVLSLYKAEELDYNDSPYLHKIVAELAQNANIPKPKICRIPEQAANAFATGRNPEHGVVAVTDGIMQILEPEELRAVLAHEIAHIANRDILLQSVASVIASSINILADFARIDANSAALRANFNNEADKKAANTRAIITTIVSILAPIAASLIQMAISRAREYEADADGARFSQNPLALASALNKISNPKNFVPLSKQNPAMESMFIVTPFSMDGMKKLFATHPPMEERIKKLRKIAEQMSLA